MVVVGILTLISPVIAILAGVFLFMAFTMFPMMLGIGLGLKVRQHKITSTYGSLIVPAIIYGTIEGVGIMLLYVIGIVALIGFSSQLSFAEFDIITVLSDDTALQTIIEAEPKSAIFLIVLDLVLASALRAALLVPLAGATAGRDANDTLHTPLVGFGTGVLPLTLLVMFSYCTLPLLGFSSVAIADMLGKGDAFDQIMSTTGSSLDRDDFTSFGMSGIWLMLGILIAWTWMFCIQCAGGVLYYLRQREQYLATKVEAVQMDPADARALWKDRM